MEKNRKMKICSDKILKIPRSGIREVFDLLLDYPDAINLCIGEPDFTTPSFIIEEAFKAAKSGATHYTANAGFLELREKISEKYKKEHELHYAPDKQIIISLGAMEALFLALMSILNEGEEVILPDPSWPNYEAQILLAGGKPVFVPTKEEEGWILTPHRIAQHLTAKTKAIILNSPANPTGCVYHKPQLEEITNITKDKDLVIISDECYEKIIYEGKHESIACLDGMQSKTIVINSFSKAYAMTGWRVGYALGDEEIIKQMTKMQEDVASCASSVSQRAALKALASGDGAVDKMLEQYRRRRSVLLGEIEKTPLTSCTPPQGAFYAFVNIKGWGQNSRDVALRWLKEAKVATVPGSAFGREGEGYLRVSFSTGEDKIKEAFHRIRNIL
ncbi:pyridoxal phosphate-dependent aminotransferase [Candidatus Aerophobetes bacterium]|nr:pyridoxal phosphate-dependent aminotransferase [Candidatus Aerophobetes bacterium]